jgi:hypothetical protein|tara:strand:- start:268 stop:597 length:330 start_codon:yes stop_codon:yes gene_type:complete
MPIVNETQEIELELSSALSQAFEDAKAAGFGGSYNDFVSSMSVEALKALLAKGGMVRKPRVKLDEGGKPIDLYQEWIKLIKFRAELSPGERKTVDDLVNRMLNADGDKD